MYEPSEPISPTKAPNLAFRMVEGISGFFSMFASKWGVREVAPAPRAYKPKPKPAWAAYTAAQVAEHATPEDAWIVVDGKVYDVSGWGAQHPGGDLIYSYAGRDATEPFAAMHKNQRHARAVMRAHLIGELAGAAVAAPDSRILGDFRQLREQFAKEGLMDASAVYYTRKMAELLLMVSGSLYLLWSGRAEASAAWLLTSALLMATFIFQCGWTGHDFLHNQVFRSHWHNTLVGAFIANFCMGASTHWWKNKHNQHHATPNKMSADNAKAVDPDIDTIPLIAWSTDLSAQVPASDRAIIRMQHIIVWPLLFIAYINWVIQGKIHLLSFPKVSSRQQRVELAVIVAHHLWLNVSIFACLSLPNAVAFWLISHCVSGFGTAFVFMQSHNGMEIYGDDKDFVTSQIVSTRNINPGLLCDWFMGGLNYQIEHHLFPTMPRHSYAVIRPRVMEFCQRHGLPYESLSVTESTVKLYRLLAMVARST